MLEGIVNVRVTAVLRGGPRSTPEDLDAFTDRLMDELMAQPDVIDPDVSGALALGEIEVSFEYEGPSQERASAEAEAVLFAVLHAAGMEVSPAPQSVHKDLTPA